MHVLQIEHPIRDFDTWKGTFDRFSGKRQESGVRRHQVLGPTDDQTTSSSSSGSTAPARPSPISPGFGARYGHRGKQHRP